MAWLFKQKGSANWWIGYRVNGKLHRCATKTPDDAEAQKQLEQHEALFIAQKSASNLEQAYEAIIGKAIQKKTLLLELNAWVQEAEKTTSVATHAKYQAMAQSLIRALRATEDAPLLSEVTTAQIQAHLDKRLMDTSPSTANLERKVLRVFFKRVTDRGLIKENPIMPIKPFKGARKTKRRDFTVDEMRAIFIQAQKMEEHSEFWQYMTLGGPYTGMRMGDLITLKIEEVDFDASWIHRDMGKIDGRAIHVYAVPPLLAAIRKQAGKRTSGFLWPAMAAKYEPKPGKKRGGWFSNQFHTILAACGIVEARANHVGKDRENGRSLPRTASNASFHSYRHTFVSQLKKTGASQTVAKELAGHSTDAISNLYTHTSTEDLKSAVSKLPEITI